MITKAVPGYRTPKGAADFGTKLNLIGLWIDRFLYLKIRDGGPDYMRLNSRAKTIL
jgi:hypothetical protein